MSSKKTIFRSLIDASSLLVSSLEVKDILPEAMATIQHLLSCEASCIMLVDEQNKKLVFEVALGEKSEHIKEFSLPLGKGIAGEVALSGEAKIVNNVASHPGFEQSFDEKSGFKTKNIICVPLKINNKIIGVAQAINHLQKDKFDDDDLCVLSIFANQVALAIESARMHKNILQQKLRDDELQFARTVQASFLPQEFPETGQFSLYGYTNSAREVGGDFYDFFYLDKQRVGFTIGDVSGKGIPAALLMAKVLSQVRFFAQKYSATNDTALVLKEVNDSLWERRSRNMFVTLIYGIFCPQEQKIIISSAAHPYPVFFDGQKKKWDIYPLSNGLPLGALAEAPYTSQEISLKNNSALIMVTDGITEVSDADNNFFLPRLLPKLPTAQMNASGLIKNITAEFTLFSQTAKIFDDVTLLAFHYK